MGSTISILQLLLSLMIQISIQRKTIIRTNWGVHFYETDSLVSNSGISYYEHSFALPWPQLKYNTSLPLNCTQHVSWYTLCKNINRITSSMNQYNFEVFSSASNTIDETLLLIPKPKENKKESSRTKRNVFVDAFTDLFHMPGRKDRIALQRHLKEVTKAIDLNTKSIQQFNNDLSSAQVLMNGRVSNLVNGLVSVESTITDVATSINQDFTVLGSDIKSLVNRTNYLSAVISYVTTKFLPKAYKKHSIMKQLLEEAEHWSEGITSLSTGYLSNFLVSFNHLSDVIQHISKKVLSQSRYSHMKLVSSNPLYYYKQKNIIATLHENVLVILVKFPLHHVGGLLKVYRTDVFPVPVTSGLTRTKGQNYDESYTFIGDIPTYFAVSNDGEYYLTLSESLYESCHGKGVKICKSGMSSLQHSTSVSCISALFFDDKKGIEKMCKPMSTLVPPMGSAIQLMGSASFLIHGAFAGNDTWRLRCINHGGSTQQSLTPCSMCRIKIPCFCTLGANQFQITARMTECAKYLAEQLPEVTYLYHPNLIMITSLFPDTEVARLKGYEANINKLFPPLPVKPPNIITSNWSKIVTKSDELTNDYKKIVVTTNQNVVSYEEKEDLIAQNVTNFSDVIVDRTTNLGKAISDALTPFPTLRHILGFLFSNLFVSLCIFMVMCLKLLKLLGPRTKLCFKRKKPKQFNNFTEPQFVARYSKLYECQ